MKRLILILAVISSFSMNTYAEDNYALRFDGIDDYVLVPDSDDWAFGTENFTIEAWVYIASFAVCDPATIIAQWTADVGCWHFSINDAAHIKKKMRFDYANDSSTTRLLSEDITVDISTWYHFAVVRNGGKVTFYQNGIATPIASYIGTNSIPNFRSTLTIGSKLHNRSPDKLLSGYIDELKISNIAKTQEQIQATMYSELMGSEPELIVYWNFNEGGGQILHDLTNNNHDGTIYGDPRWVAGAPLNH